MILMDGDEGAARDAVFASSGKCEQRAGGWLERATKTAANGFMLVGSRGARVEVLIAITGPKTSVLLGLDFLARFSKYLVVVLKPMVK